VRVPRAVILPPKPEKVEILDFSCSTGLHHILYCKSRGEDSCSLAALKIGVTLKKIPQFHCSGSENTVCWNRLSYLSLAYELLYQFLMSLTRRPLARAFTLGKKALSSRKIHPIPSSSIVLSHLCHESFSTKAHYLLQRLNNQAVYICLSCPSPVEFPLSSTVVL